MSRPANHLAATHYGVMYLKENANIHQIRRAYLDLSKTTHPDKNDPSKKAEYTTRFQILNNAYQILSDRIQRKIYDETLEEGRRQRREEDEKIRQEQEAQAHAQEKQETHTQTNEEPQNADEEEPHARDQEEPQTQEKEEPQTDHKDEPQAQEPQTEDKEETQTQNKRKASSSAEHSFKKARPIPLSTFNVYVGNSDFDMSGGPPSLAKWSSTAKVAFRGTLEMTLMDTEVEIMEEVVNKFNLGNYIVDGNTHAVVFTCCGCNSRQYGPTVTKQVVAPEAIYTTKEINSGLKSFALIQRKNTVLNLVVFPGAIQSAASPHPSFASPHTGSSSVPQTQIQFIFGGKRCDNVHYVAMKSSNATTSWSFYAPPIDIGTGTMYVSDLSRYATSVAKQLDREYDSQMYQIWRVTGETVDISKTTSVMMGRKCQPLGPEDTEVPAGARMFAILPRNLPDTTVKYRGGSNSDRDKMPEEKINGCVYQVLAALRTNKMPEWFAHLEVMDRSSPIAGKSVLAFLTAVSKTLPLQFSQQE